MELQVTDKLTVADCQSIISVVKNRGELQDMSAEEITSLLNDQEVYSIFINNKIVAFTGVIRPWLSRGVVYFLADPDICMRQFVIVKNVVKGILDCFFEDPSLNRLEAQVKADFKGALNWAEKVGFKRESLMPKWGIEGEDYYMYRMVK